jgi:ubiquinone/menaquinone biosynthesis C-methylase UbiE
LVAPLNKTVFGNYYCPFCHTPIKPISGVGKDVLINGTVVCRSGRHHFAVVLGRPIFLHPGQFHGWTPPITEALGLNRRESLDDSLRRLRDIGLERAIKKVITHEKSVIVGNIGASALQVLRSPGVVEKARYRKSGEWFRHRNRMRFKALGQTLGSIDNANQAIRTAWAWAIQTKPRRYLDLASGSGNALLPIVHNASTLEYAAAVERDINCLWSLQYRLDHIRHKGIAEAIGADVRNLPFPDELFDLATINVSLAEICGISKAIREAHRVLSVDGWLIVINHEKIFDTVHYDKALVDALPMHALKRFADKADLFYTYEQFEKLCKRSGFAKIFTRFFDDKNGRLFVSRMSK